MPKKKVDIHWLNEPEVKLYSPEGGDNRDSGAERFGTLLFAPPVELSAKKFMQQKHSN